MRRVITLILLAADIYLGVQIYRSFMNDQFRLNALAFKLDRDSRNDSSDSGSSEYSPGPMFPTGQSTFGIFSNTDEPTPAPSSPEYREEDYGTRDSSVIRRFQEFDWYRNEVLFSGIPANAYSITDPMEIYGNYHVYVLFDPDNQNDMIADLLGDARIDNGQYGTLVHIDWTYTYYHKDGEGETDDTSSDFTGSLDNGSIRASGPGTLSIDSFFYEEGEIRAVGSMAASNGIPANVALVKQ
ncbi:MAG: hypothetical protein IKD66_10930 [Solobacterium sp.]|nr:hypothetical protein [Solobacterium sp.]